LLDVAFEKFSIRGGATKESCQSLHVFLCSLTRKKKSSRPRCGEIRYAKVAKASWRWVLVFSL
jgi:hypothetical protein